MEAKYVLKCSFFNLNPPSVPLFELAQYQDQTHKVSYYFSKLLPLAHQRASILKNLCLPKHTNLMKVLSTDLK